MNSKNGLKKGSFIFTNLGLEPVEACLWDIYGENGYSENAKTDHAGYNMIYEIITVDGNKLYATAEQEFLTKDGWVKTEDLLNKELVFNNVEKDWIGYIPDPTVDYKSMGKFCRKKTIPSWAKALPKKEMAQFLSGLFGLEDLYTCHEYEYTITIDDPQSIYIVQGMLAMHNIRAKTVGNTITLLCDPTCEDSVKVDIVRMIGEDEVYEIKNIESAVTCGFILRCLSE